VIDRNTPRIMAKVMRGFFREAGGPKRRERLPLVFCAIARSARRMTWLNSGRGGASAIRVASGAASARRSFRRYQAPRGAAFARQCVLTGSPSFFALVLSSRRAPPGILHNAFCMTSARQAFRMFCCTSPRRQPPWQLPRDAGRLVWRMFPGIGLVHHARRAESNGRYKRRSVRRPPRCDSPT
jgi:hypothetical protein